MQSTDTMIINPQGWLQGVKQRPSPNYNQRPDSAVVDLIVLHNISLPPGQYGSDAISDFFCNQLDFSADAYFNTLRGIQVSSHCLIARCGEITQYVAFSGRAWHCGQSVFQGRTNCNDFSIGIELEGTDTQAFTQAQYRELAALITCLRQHYPAITLDRIVGHSDIAPGRKTDPGPSFDWTRLHQLLSRDPGVA